MELQAMTQATTARQKLAEIIRHHIKESGKNDREVSARVGVPIREVERWKDGTLVPTGHQWKKLCHMVSRALQTYMPVHRDALREQENDHDMTLRSLQRNGHSQRLSDGKVVTNFGDKLVEAVTAAAAPPPQIEQAPLPSQNDTTGQDQQMDKPRRTYTAPPPGSRSLEAMVERRAFARSILLQRPAIPSRGEDGLIKLVQTRFGIGISEYEINKLKLDMERERLEAKARDLERPAPATGQQVVAAAQTAGFTVADVKDIAAAVGRQVPVAPPPAPALSPGSPSDVQAGVELILSAIPNLLTLTIRVDDKGEASVEYDVKATVSNKLTVRR